MLAACEDFPASEGTAEHAEYAERSPPRSAFSAWSVYSAISLWSFCCPSVLTSLLVAASVLAHPSPRNAGLLRQRQPPRDEGWRRPSHDHLTALRRRGLHRCRELLRPLRRELRNHLRALRLLDSSGGAKRRQLLRVLRPRHEQGRLGRHRLTPLLSAAPQSCPPPLSPGPLSPPRRWPA